MSRSRGQLRYLKPLVPRINDKKLREVATAAATNATTTVFGRVAVPIHLVERGSRVPRTKSPVPPQSTSDRHAGTSDTRATRPAPNTTTSTTLSRPPVSSWIFVPVPDFRRGWFWVFTSTVWFKWIRRSSGDTVCTVPGWRLRRRYCWRASCKVGDSVVPYAVLRVSVRHVDGEGARLAHYCFKIFQRFFNVSNSCWSTLCDCSQLFDNNGFYLLLDGLAANVLLCFVLMSQILLTILSVFISCYLNDILYLCADSV